MTPRDWATVALWSTVAIGGLAVGLTIGLVGVFMAARGDVWNVDAP